MEQLTKNQAVATSQEAVQNQNEPQLRDENAHNDKSVHGVDRKSGSAGMPRPISYAVFCLKKKTPNQGHIVTSIDDGVHRTWGLDEGTSGCYLLRRALVRPNDVLLDQSATRENDIAHSLVVMPWDGIAGVHCERMNLDRAGHRIAGTVTAEVITGKIGRAHV